MAETKLKFDIDKKVLIAILPFAGYLVAYNYEKGYLSFFSIPSFLIRLGFEEIIVATSVLASSLVVLYLFLIVVYPFLKLFKSIKSAKGRAFFQAAIMFLLLISFVFIFSPGSLLNKLIGFLIISIALFFYYFGFPFLFFRGKTMNEKILKAEKADKRVGQVEDFIFSRPRLLAYWGLFLFLLVISGLAYSAGQRDASKQKNFLVVQGEETFIILRSYTDKRIAVGIDTNLKVVKDNIQLIKSSDNINTKLKEVGPLKKKIEEY